MAFEDNKKICIWISLVIFLISIGVLVVFIIYFLVKQHFVGTNFEYEVEGKLDKFLE